MEDVVVEGRTEILKRLVFGTIGGAIYMIVVWLLNLPVAIFVLIALGLTMVALPIDALWGLISGRESKFLSASMGKLLGAVLKVQGFFLSWGIQAMKYVLLLSNEKPYPLGPKAKNLLEPAYE